MFDFTGKKLPSLDVFKYVRYGAVGPNTEIMTDLTDPDLLTVDVSIGGNVVMPETLDVTYNDTSVTSPLKLTWNTEDIDKIDTSAAGAYSVNGTAVSDALPGEEIQVTATVNVANINYVVNPSFEDDNVGSPWNSFSDGGSAPVDIQDKEADAHDGTKAFHYYKAADFAFDMQQEITDIPAGTYVLTSYIQGGDMGENAVIYMYAFVGEKEMDSESITVDGWQQWKKAEIRDIEVHEGDTVTIGYYIESAGGGWGTIDDFDLSLMN